ncbi:MAG: enoyl-CoA hydratase/isomerase family protein [Pirellulales bacterium]|nr:enoyl-CoA hydratase/isomerase family protein [Pirellulales bacterium]
MSQSTAAPIVVGEVKAGVKWVRFNRPEVRNAVTLESADLARAEIDSAASEGARVIVLTGSGGSFSSGADLKAVAGAFTGEMPSVKKLLADHYHPLIKSMVESPLPVIAAVDGAAAGIGCDFALAADMRLASDRAFFSHIFVNISLIPDGGGTFHLPRLVGLGRALEMAMLGERVTAEEAHAWGLVNHVYPTANFEEQVQEFAASLAKKAPLSLERSKRAMRASLGDHTIGQALAREADLQEELFASEDFKEGVMAFLSKRPAEFRGK